MTEEIDFFKVFVCFGCVFFVLLQFLLVLKFSQKKKQIHKQQQQEQQQQRKNRRKKLRFDRMSMYVW